MKVQKNASACEHTDRKHCAKGFCRPCYLGHFKAAKNGKEYAPRTIISTSKATRCGHSNRKNFYDGRCRPCDARRKASNEADQRRYRRAHPNKPLTFVPVFDAEGKLLEALKDEESLLNAARIFCEHFYKRKRKTSYTEEAVLQEKERLRGIRDAHIAQKDASK